MAETRVGEGKIAEGRVARVVESKAGREARKSS